MPIGTTPAWPARCRPTTANPDAIIRDLALGLTSRPARYGRFSGDTGTVLNEAQHWNGSTWALVSTPDPGGTATLDSNTLRAVRCTTASNCWAVGDAQKNGAADLNQALFWNGTKWSTR